ncbi:transketolase subunit B [Roseovarius marisflavi]|uniref:Transketolase subunit B n=1 Tax=Roseovarius marisflavi TaxID=1054996 RepID=A0A1M7BRI2_9RHOB|nr:transketolase C-terminal domain-containing protein [Roseovarius marisflavi]SHL57591.1 transketolase subunit B [Roseovarius marisflavi]
MAQKSWMYSVLEAVQYEMQQDPAMTWIFELTPPVASNPGKPVINLETEFGRKRVVNTGIDENWMASAVLGAGLAGSRSATYIPYQGALMPLQVIQNVAGKLRHMTGGKASMPVVWIIEMTGQSPGFAGQHSCYEEDTYYAHIPGVRTVIPSTPYDAKGMMVSALRSPDPVVYLYPAGLRGLTGEVPDEQYEVPLDKAAVRQEGSDLTIVSSGAGMPGVLEAAATLTTEGMSVEVIDLRVLKEMDTETLVNSVAKTKRLLTVDQSYYTLCPGAEVIARVAENVDGARYKRVAFPDAPPPASPEMFLWMRPNADHIMGAARALV